MTMVGDLAAVAAGLGRDVALSRMLSTIRVTREPDEDAPPVWDPDAPGNGDYVQPGPYVVYGPDTAPHYGRARARMGTAAASILGGGTVLTLSAIHVPHDVVLAVGDEVTVIASDNPAAVGVTRTIRALHTGDQQTANRYGFEEIGGR